MEYSTLVRLYERLESTTKKLEKRDILAELYNNLDSKDMYPIVMLSMGSVFPQGAEDLGVARGLVKQVIAKAYGANTREIEEKFRDLGDLGTVAEYFASHRRQRTLVSKDLTVSLVFDNLRKLPTMTGAGSQERKINIIGELLTNAKPREACYIVRTVLGDMRIGVAHGLVRDAIAKAFGHEAKEVEHVFNLIGDFGTVAELAKSGKMKAEVSIGRPIRVMLADRIDSLKTAMEKIENPAIEIKYDGFRLGVHKEGNTIKLFSRRLDEVTRQFPELVNAAKENIRAKQCIIDGEAIAFDRNTGNPRPFQHLSRRIQRKYDIEKMVKEVPIKLKIFDIIYLNGKSLMDETLDKRWSALKKTIKETKLFRLADHLETKDFAKAEKFYKQALASGQEGAIVKNMDAQYRPGRRVGTWLKVKEILDPLDLVIIGAEWGEGKRANTLGSLILAARHGNKFIPTGRMASGLTDEHLFSITKKLRKLITKEEGKIVEVRPEIVIEVGYEEIQRSPKYPSGYALRFPRLLRLRENEKKAKDADTLKTIEKLFRQQKRRK